MSLNDAMAVCFALFREFGSWAYWVKVVEDTLIHSASEMYPQNLAFSGVSLMVIFAENHSQRGAEVKWHIVASENFTCNQP